MTKTWRKITALILLSVFFSLSVLVEFSHRHLERFDHTTLISQHETSQTDSTNTQNHSFVCLACVYGLTQLAPEATTHRALKPEQEALYLLLKDSTFYTVILPTSFYLRAPPLDAA